MRCLAILSDSHGRGTLGKRTPLFSDGTFMEENEFSSSVVNAMSDLLETYDDIDVFYAAPEKRDISLDERVQRINDVYNDGKNIYEKIVLVSVHANAMYDYWNTVGSGTATFYYPGNYIDRDFAEIIQRNLISKTKLPAHRGGVVAENFQILRESKCTACLCECAFMDNLEEAKLLLTGKFRQACAEGITNGLLEYFGINQVEKEVDNVVRYKKYNDRIHELRGNATGLDAKIVDKKIWDITEYTNCTNGTFFWHDDKGNTYSTSPLIIDGIVYQRYCNHKLPQSVFVIYKDGTVTLQKVTDVYNLKDFKNIRLAIGGIGLRNTQDSSFRYSPVSEGFKGKFADVLAKRNKTVLGYNEKLNKVYLLVVKNASHSELLKLIYDNSAGEAYDIAISVDGGGSTFMDANNEYVFQGENSRRIHNIIGFGL